MKKLFSVFLVVLILQSQVLATEFSTNSTAKSLLLMESSSGKIIYEYNSHESLPPASVTKIMTMLLICEALERNEIALDTQIVASERAKSMGGSTIFLDTNEVMSLEDMLKGIAVASANDACVAVAEHLCGSVESFVDRMNSRARELGMKDSNFVNCNGLDAENHYTSAYDIALMSRELLKHKMIEKYTTIWMDTLREGNFQLANTNKLIRFYQGANGLKTGSTSDAGCCISATAKRDGMQLIAVVMGAPTSKERFSAASELLNFGFSNFTVNSYGEKGSPVCKVSVLHGVFDKVIAVTRKDTTSIIEKNSKDRIKTHINIEKDLVAPVKKGDVIGEMIITLDGETISKTELLSDRDVDRKRARDYFLYMFKGFLSV